MPAPQRRFSVTAAGDVALTAATEAVVATLNGVSTQAADNVVQLDGWSQINALAGVTTVTLRIRRTGLTGTLVGEANPENIPASQMSQANISTSDSPGDVAGLTYVLTATVAGGNATAQQQQLEAEVG